MRKSGKANSVSKLLKERGVNPFGVLADVAGNHELDPVVRVRAASELAQYVEPKLRSVEINQGVGEQKRDPIDLSDYKKLDEVVQKPQEIDITKQSSIVEGEVVPPYTPGEDSEVG